jgi:hypothetical protein
MADEMKEVFLSAFPLEYVIRYGCLQASHNELEKTDDQVGFFPII